MKLSQKLLVSMKRYVSPMNVPYVQADQAFNILDNSVTIAEENLQNPPSATYFLPSPPPEEEMEEVEEEIEVSESEQGEEDSVKTGELTPAHLKPDELKALRRRMKKSFSWVPKPSCIKNELQRNGRWPLRSIEKKARRKVKIAKIKRKRQRVNSERVLAVRKAAQAGTEKRLNGLRNSQKEEKKIRYTQMPVAVDEPTYCYCGDVSYGEMIACENEVSYHRPIQLLILVLSKRMVSFRLCWLRYCSERQVVLS